MVELYGRLVRGGLSRNALGKLHIHRFRERLFNGAGRSGDLQRRGIDGRDHCVEEKVNSCPDREVSSNKNHEFLSGMLHVHLYESNEAIGYRKVNTILRKYIVTRYKMRYRYLQAYELKLKYKIKFLLKFCNKLRLYSIYIYIHKNKNFDMS